MLQIPPDEYRTRLETLQTEVQEAGLDPFVVSTLDSLYYLTGAGFGAGFENIPWNAHSSS